MVQWKIQTLLPQKMPQWKNSYFLIHVVSSLIWLCGVSLSFLIGWLLFLQNADGEVTWIEDMRVSLEELVLLLRDEHTVSSYELQSSGLVQTLLNILNNVSP